MITNNNTKHFLSALIVIFFIVIALGSSDTVAEESIIESNTGDTPFTERQIKAKKQATKRRTLIDEQFDPLYGSHPALTQIIKSHLNDPDSFKHIETKFRDDDDHLFLTTTFTATNAFGGRTKHVVSAKVDFEGNVLEIIDQY